MKTVEWEVWTLDPTDGYRRRTLLVRTIERPWHGPMTAEVLQWLYTTRSMRLGPSRRHTGWRRDDRPRLKVEGLARSTGAPTSETS